MGGLKLKLNTSSLSNINAPSSTTPQTPLATPGGSKPTLKFKIATKSSNPSSPVVPSPATQNVPKPKKTKAGRAPKPSAKLQDSLKRVKSESPDDDTISVLPPPKKLKLSIGPKTPATPGPFKIGSVVIKPKIKGKPPKRPLGEGYDSEASDRETDPAIEEEFVLRMMPGDDCEYLRQMIDQKKIGLHKAQGGADVHMKFMHGDGRRAAITIRGKIYAATLVDLPTVIEGMKSWDRRGWWKSADICQMLWVFARIQKEDDARTIALPSIIDQETYQYPHGLTAPMHHARTRRFRKRISRTAIEAVEDAVEKLLDADARAEETRWEVVDLDRQGSSAFSPGGSSPPDFKDEQYSGEEDAEGELDDMGYFGNGHAHANGGLHQEPDDLDLEADLEAAMDAEELEAATPASTLGATPSMATGETPIAQDDSGDESIEDEDEDDENDEPGEVDEEEKTRLSQLQATRDDIIDLERQLVDVQSRLATQANPILKRRIEDNLRKIQNEIQLKKSSIGEGEQGGDE